jgi:DNA mismatch repair ATPase MutL
LDAWDAPGITNVVSHIESDLTDNYSSKRTACTLQDHTYGHLGRSLACISSISDVVVRSAIYEGATYSKVIGESHDVKVDGGHRILASGTRVVCSKLFENRQSLRQKQQVDFPIQHSKFVRFLG